MSNRFPTHATGYPSAPRWLTVFVPAIVYPVAVVSAFAAPPLYSILQRKEGLIEYLAVAFLLFGIVYGVLLLAKHRHAFPKKWLVAWFAIATLGMIVFAGEEISWGQHLSLFQEEDIPESIRNINDQDELNLHNITNALDQGPTNAIVLGTFFAFVILPIIQRVKKETMGIDNPGYWFWPTRAGLIAAIGVLIIPFPKRIYEWTTGEVGPDTLRHSEFHEFYIALLMTIYMVDAYRRAKAIASTQHHEPTDTTTAHAGQ